MECKERQRYVCLSLSLRRFKRSKRVEKKTRGGVDRENSFHGDHDIIGVLCLNGSFVCVEVKANNSLEMTEGGTL